MVPYRRMEKLGKGRLQKFLEYLGTMEEQVGNNIISTKPENGEPADAELSSTKANNIEESPVKAQDSTSWLEDDKKSDDRGIKTIDILDGVMKATGYLELYDENDPE